MQKGVVIGGTLSKLLARQKAGTRLQVGEVVVIEYDSGKMLAQVSGLDFASSLTQQTLEMVSGIHLEESELDVAEQELRYYSIASLKPLVAIEGTRVTPVKTLPPVFSSFREVTKDDLTFLGTPRNPLLLGYLRSGSDFLDVPMYCNATQMLSHHVLIAATTGRGKSNLTSCLLWNLAGSAYGGVLVLDPHDEYYGRSGLGLKDHPGGTQTVVYYTPSDVPPGQRTLSIHVSHIKPHHLEGCMPWSDPQREALVAYYRRYNIGWIEALLHNEPVEGFHESTLAVIKRRITRLLDIRVNQDELVCNGIFDTIGGRSTVTDILNELEEGKIVIVNTSDFPSASEILIGSIFANEIFQRHRRYKLKGELASKHVVSIVLEEAPRVLGKEALEKGPNIFSSIAREGRKFKLGLIAITQLPSLIPRDILANMNTKIILGIEMKPERTAIMESAAQDLSSDDRHIASLDVGEALVTSHFLKFAAPLVIPRFDTLVKRHEKEVKVDLRGIGIG